MVASYNYKIEEKGKELNNKKLNVLSKMESEGITEPLCSQLSQINSSLAHVGLYYISKSIARTIVELKTKSHCTGSITYDLSHKECQEREEELLQDSLTLGVRLNLIGGQTVNDFKKTLMKHRKFIAYNCTDEKEIAHKTIDKNLIQCLNYSGSKEAYKQKVMDLYTNEIW